jgi:hypothetical protein
MAQRPYSFKDLEGRKHTFTLKKRAIAARRKLGIDPTKHPIRSSIVKVLPANKGIIRAFRTEYKKRTGKELSHSEALKSRELQKLLRDLATVDNSPNSRKAKALVKLGRRSPTWQFKVGETPPGVKALFVIRR